MPRSQAASIWAARGLLIFVTLVWGATFTLTKEALVVLPVYAFLSLRFAAAALATLVLAFLPRYRSSAWKDARTWAVGAAAGIPLGASFLLQTEGLRTITPGLSGFLTGLNVVIVPVLTSALTKRRPDARTWWGATMAGAGLLCMCVGTPLAGRWEGVAETILCAWCIALQIAAVDRWAKGLDAFAVAAVEVWVTALLAWAAALVTGQWAPVVDARAWMAPVAWAAVLVNGLLGTAFALWAQNWAQERLSSAQTAVTFALEPVFAAAIGWWTLGEPMTGPEILGGLLIVASMAVAPA
ncbi:DMT family transporter [Alicyclobacillus sendaiensis]|uniref:DMT family transporter n=1 Tax=Alicyclobacillus sendaiensis PA2 TaxID=3029425 RepID=A0ABT6XVU5_ALISE|nr:DMT family transporter [Alicyclobacillus sendaiensis]MDI9259211.1 DMT family transporter [Alicyclobacillus sendaiensis PA2]